MITAQADVGTRVRSLSKTQYSPAPWTLSRKERVVFSGDIIVACLPEHGSVPDANARLIAAAPELLVALTAAIKEMDDFQKYWTSPNMGMIRGACKAQELARAVFAKLRLTD